MERWRWAGVEAAFHARASLSGFFVTGFGRCAGFQSLEQAGRGRRDLLDGRSESRFVGFRRFMKAGDLTDELESGGLDLRTGCGRLEIEEGFDVAAHRFRPGASADRQSSVS